MGEGVVRRHARVRNTEAGSEVIRAEGKGQNLCLCPEQELSVKFNRGEAEQPNPEGRSKVITTRSKVVDKVMLDICTQNCCSKSVQVFVAGGSLNKQSSGEFSRAIISRHRWAEYADLSC